MHRYNYGFMPVFQANSGFSWFNMDVQGGEYQSVVARDATFGLQALRPGAHVEYDLWPLSQNEWQQAPPVSTAPIPTQSWTRFKLNEWVVSDFNCSALEVDRDSSIQWYALQRLSLQQVDCRRLVCACVLIRSLVSSSSFCVLVTVGTASPRHWSAM